MMQMLMRGGPPPSDKSQVGKEFDHYMRDAVTAQFPQSFREPTQRTTDIWADRGIVVTVVDPSDRSTVPDVIKTSAKIINLVQFNRTPFDAHTQWALEVKYDDPDMHKQMLGNSYVLNHRKSKKKKGKKKPTTNRTITKTCTNKRLFIFWFVAILKRAVPCTRTWRISWTRNPYTCRIRTCRLRLPRHPPRKFI
jgi:hypothetical protein